MNKPFYQSKTFWLNGITIVLAFLALPEFTSVVPETWLPFIAVVNGFGNLVLRYFYPPVQPQ